MPFCYGNPVGLKLGFPTGILNKRTHEKICIFLLGNSRRIPAWFAISRRKCTLVPQGLPLIPVGLCHFLRDCNHFFRNILELFRGPKKGPPTPFFFDSFSKLEEQLDRKIPFSKAYFRLFKVIVIQWSTSSRCASKRFWSRTSFSSNCLHTSKPFSKNPKKFKFSFFYVKRIPFLSAARVKGRVEEVSLLEYSYSHFE